MSAAGMSIEDLQLRKKLLLEELAESANELLKRNVSDGAIDIHHPERSPGWKPYRFQEYPKIMYHLIQRDPRIEEQRMNVRRRNDANPNLAPLEMPAVEPLKIKVQNKAEEEEAVKKGFVKLPPVLASEDKARAPKLDPLAASMGIQPKPPLSAEVIISLNGMSKDDLVAEATEKYGIDVPDDATKLQIITAIQNRAA